MIEQGKDYSLGTKAFFLYALEEMKWVLCFVALAILVSIFRDATQATFLIHASKLLDTLSWLGIVGGLIWSYWKFRTTTFAFEEFGLKLKKGIIEKREITIPYRQIQSVDIVRGLTHQLLGLSKISMLTAGHEEGNEKGLTEVVLEPIDKHFAEEIRAALQERIGVQIVRTEGTPPPALDASAQP